MKRRDFLIGVGAVGLMSVMPDAHADPYRETTFYGGLIRELNDERFKVTRVRKLIIPGGYLVLVETGDYGYYIFDPVTNYVLEYSEVAKSPYLHIPSGVDLYYSGPQHYYVQERSQFAHTILDESLTVEEIKSYELAPVLARVRDSNQQKDILRAEFKIKSYGYITGCGVPNNTTSICGYAAAAIVLRYWHARQKRSYIFPRYYLKGNNLRDRSGFSNYLRNNYGSSNSTWGLDIGNTLNRYFKANKIASARAGYYLLSCGITSEIHASRPIILFGDLPDPRSNKNIVSHAVVDYGISRHGHNIVHYGWPGYTRVVLSSGFIGSSTWMKP